MASTLWLLLTDEEKCAFEGSGLQLTLPAELDSRWVSSPCSCVAVGSVDADPDVRIQSTATSFFPGSKLRQELGHTMSPRFDRCLFGSVQQPRGKAIPLIGWGGFGISLNANVDGNQTTVSIQD